MRLDGAREECAFAAAVVCVCNTRKRFGTSLVYTHTFSVYFANVNKREKNCASIFPNARHTCELYN